ncbi:MAG TPA: DUF4337 domain-containing protein [Geobacteraceae bacterium]|nr:DUF4337 domain-containing protein [Geobacteraceae bacterium]
METNENNLGLLAARNRLNDWVAVSVAILSAFMAVTKVKDDNIVQAMLQVKSDAVDTWSEYQSKRIKQHLAEVGLMQTQALSVIAPERGKVVLADQERDYRNNIARYAAEEETLKKKARGFEKDYDDLNYRDDQFDMSDAALSLSLALLAVTALTSKRKLFAFSWLFGGFGVVMGLAGLVGLSLHPDWLTKLLS